MILGFHDDATREFFATGKTKKGWQSAASVAKRTLDMVDAATKLRDLERPPSNRLEPLKGKRKGQYSIRINDKWRVCFIWTYAGPKRVEITDYHDE
jgi:toxin HigB-1